MIEAVVQTGQFETTYRRAGSGGPVLLLQAAWPGAAGWLFDALSGGFRVIAPVLPAEARAAGPEGPGVLESWLRGLIDGLGLERPGIVAPFALGAALLRFAAADPDRIDRLVLLGSPEGEDPGDLLSGAGQACPAGVGHRPVLMCCLPPADRPDGRVPVHGEIQAFLARGA